MAVTKLHHAAYRCNDAQETADFYTKYLGLEYYAAVSEEDVPSTGEKCPYMHIFFAMKDGSCVAFFEVPASPPMQKDPNTPEWVQHLALNVESKEELLARKKLLVEGGFDVIGPTNHGFCESIYFFDPNPFIMFNRLIDLYFSFLLLKKTIHQDQVCLPLCHP